MTLRDTSEWQLIEKIRERFPINDRDRLGIGDDCSVLPIDDDNSLITTTDLLAEDVHFLRHRISPSDLGYKSLAVSLSDIAAMGGSPSQAYLSMALPPSLELHYIDRFLDGFSELCETHQIALMGGDTSSSLEKIFINVLVQGQAPARQIKRRSEAHPGDRLVLTSPVGESWLGLQTVLGRFEMNESTEHFVEHHHRPRPQLAEGQFLSQFSGVHAMIDISDGIASDVGQICRASQVGCRIQINDLPTTSEFDNFCRDRQLDGPQIAVQSGEEYGLLLSIAPGDFEEIDHAFRHRFDRPLRVIGHIEKNAERLFYKGDERKIPRSFSHFAEGL